MAKQSIVKVIRAKPNARGKTSHLPIACDACKKNDSVVHYGEFHNRKRVCWSCWINPPQKEESPKKSAQRKLFKSLGLV